MRRFIIVPDSFKGSIASDEAADVLAEVIEEKLHCETIKLPIADGGEGSVDCILRAKGGVKKYVKVHSPEGKIIDAGFGIIDEKTAVIEIAESSGLTKQTGFHALSASTFGFGELIKAALDMGCRDFFLCLGGSATTDCGCGMAAALGISFYDKDGKSFTPTGGTLADIMKIDRSKLDNRISESTFTVMSDVSNPLYGELGAAYVYAPQKGASEKEVEILDAGLRSVARVIQRDCGTDCHMDAAGAAGGAGYGCAAFLGAKVISGIEGLLQICGFDEWLTEETSIVTGEGRLDGQSLMGKVLSGIRRHAKDKEIISFCGSCELTEEELTKQQITAVEIGAGVPLEECMSRGAYYLKRAAERYFCTSEKREDITALNPEQRLVREV